MLRAIDSVNTTISQVTSPVSLCTVHQRLGVGQPDVALAIGIADGVFGVGPQVFVQADGVRLKSPTIVWFMSKLVICAAECQVVPEVSVSWLDQHDIGPAFLGQVIQGRTSRDAATDHGNHELRACLPVSRSIVW